MNKKIYIIGIGGIGTSAIARYYNDLGYNVYGSDKVNSLIIENLKKEGIDVIIGERPDFITNTFEKVIYTEAIPKNNKELNKALELGITTESYAKAIGEIGNNNNMIAISGTHGKSTTTSLVSLILKNGNKNFTSIVGTLLFEFDGKNYYRQSNNDLENFFVIEACEYKKSFHNYTPYILSILNIEVDHLDFYKDGNDYIQSFKDMIDRVKKGGYVIINGQERNSNSLIGIRKDINYIVVNDDKYINNGQEYSFPNIKLNIPGDHMLYDAKFAYIIGKLLGIKDDIILETLLSYNGAWRRMEKIGITNNNNIVISDYGHHPTEIKKTLSAIRSKYSGEKILTIFQPHQYSRTINLINEFVGSFGDTDELIIPNIYASRDTEEDKLALPPELFVEKIKHNNKIYGNGLENTLKLIKKFDEENKNSVILIMGAGDVDSLRNLIQYK